MASKRSAATAATQRGHFAMPRCGIDGVQAVEASSSQSFARHSHEQYGIGVVLAGAQKSASGRGIVEAGPGDTIMVNPGEVHDGAPLGGLARTWKILYFEPGLIRAAMRDLDIGGPAGCELPPVLRDARLAEAQQALYAFATSPAARVRHAPLLQSQLMLILMARAAIAPRTLPTPPTAPAHSSAMQIARARQRLDDDPSAAVTLEMLARDCDLSQFQLLRAFARATGLTPHAYQIQRRIETARRLIARGTPLAEAAMASGFADQSHMTRIFVRNYGVSPSQYAGATR